MASDYCCVCFFFSSRRRHTRCALVTGVQTCALPILTSFPMLAPRTWRPLGAAWTVALVSSLAVLFIGEVMGQAPCNLCWFQRVFVFPLAQLGRASCRERVCQYV